ncbi:STAS domain-containing protein [Catenuloplanes sp. NPDC051500]|uniref:STAS domain-containing protein n=1 Tax=Catenuloplanes sp. NPDC051500 TaxID=3363959 RepID=UPI0037A259CE
MTGSFSVVKSEDGEGTIRLTISGDVDNDVAAALTEIISNAAEQPGAGALVVDLDRVSVLAAAGIRALLEGRAAAERCDRAYRIVNVHDDVTVYALRVVGLADIVAPVTASQQRR